MVTQIVKYGIWACLGLAAALVLAAYWLLWTTSGAQWLLGAVSRWTPVSVEASQVEGALANDLRLEGVQVGWPEGGADADRLHLQWRLTSLLGGHLAVEELTAAGIEVRLPAAKEKPPEPVPSEPFSFAWPKLTGVPLRLQADIKRLEVTDLTLRPADGDPVVIDRVAAGLGWRDGVLSILGLEVASGFASGRADLRAGFVEPLLELAAEASLAEAAAGLDRFVLSADLDPGDLPGGVAGALSLEAFSGAQGRYRLEADLALQENRLQVGSLALTRPGQPGRVTVQGELTLEADPDLKLEVHLAELDLLQETGVATLVSGTLRVTGRPSAYQGDFSLTNRVKGWQDAELAGTFAGDLKEISLADLQGG